jgi:hypothetical protein
MVQEPLYIVWNLISLLDDYRAISSANSMATHLAKKHGRLTRVIP